MIPYLRVFVGTMVLLARRPMAMNAARHKVRPNILHILLDDFGWGDAGWHGQGGVTQRGLETPAMTQLASSGVILNRLYGYTVCSPTRSSIQSGRNPLQVNAHNLPPGYWNPANNVSGFPGIPTEMTGLAEVMSGAGYKTHFYGKWDAGSTAGRQSPKARGYQHGLGYWGHGNDYWNFGTPGCDGLLYDVFAFGKNTTSRTLINGTDGCDEGNHSDCVHLEGVYTHAVMDAIRFHNPAYPFFIFWAPHLVHDPFQIQDKYVKPWAHILDDDERVYCGMVTLADEEVGRVTDLLKSMGLWNSTLVVLHSDNGGSHRTGSNEPLRGGKFTNWEGGVRLAGFVSGGYLPERARGKTRGFLMHVSDWYATYAHLAGLHDVTDYRAAAANLPPVDSKNAWKHIVNGGALRDRIVLGASPTPPHDGNDEAVVAGLVTRNLKILVGEQLDFSYPRLRGAEVATKEVTSTKRMADGTEMVTIICGRTPETGCLFNISDSQGNLERHNVAHHYPETFRELLAIVDLEQGNVFNPNRGVLQEDFFCERMLARGRVMHMWLAKEDEQIS